MQPEERDAALLWDMREAACEIAPFVKRVSYEEFVSKKVLRYAVERQVLVIGEAAARVSSTLRDAHPEIPWGSIIAQRNILAHEYGEILVERIWRVASQRIPELIRLLDPAYSRTPWSRYLIAVLMASITHFGNYTRKQKKEYLADRGIPVHL